MWFRLGSSVRKQAQDPMWDDRLCISWASLRQIIWNCYWFVVLRSIMLLTDGWKMPFLSYKSKINNEKNYQCKKWLNIDWFIWYKITNKYSTLDERFHLQASNKKSRIENECWNCFTASINCQVLWWRASRHSESLQKKVLILIHYIISSSWELKWFYVIIYINAN